MSKTVARENLTVDKTFAAFVEDEFAPFVNKPADMVWQEIAALDRAFNEKIENALQLRETIQGQIDGFFRENPDFEQSEYEKFLKEIGYIEPEAAPFKVSTLLVDDEVARVAAPQLVVPISNARFALNAANARYVSLYDALYGTNAILEKPTSKAFDPKRAQSVAEYVKNHLDEVAPLEGLSWQEATRFDVEKSELRVNGSVSLKVRDQFEGYRGAPHQLEEIILNINGLRLRLVFDEDAPVAKLDPAHISDVIVEAALTTIMDCEDSVAAVDGADKALVYHNWLGLNRGDLHAEIRKGERLITRRLREDIEFFQPSGRACSLKARSLMFVRNVGHLMRNPAIMHDDHHMFEGLMDAYFTIGIAAQNEDRDQAVANSAHGSIYVVKPKMHGSAEVRLSCEIFSQVEGFYGLAPETVKIGIMDEERRTSVNLAQCIEAAKTRVAFINTGFLDRTGDEIHTHMMAGAMVPKAEMKSQDWLNAYEKRNVEIGLAQGLQYHAQIGKGMWAKPDDMRGLLEEKIGHPQSGANTAWVPSPTAAAIHALHYHRVDVFAVQDQIMSEPHDNRLNALLTPPLLGGRNLDETTISNELENNLQGILGYVVRWVDQGIGCSTVPDIHDVGLMEDRATCRISAQMVANWLKQGLVSADEVNARFSQVAKIVDRQNANDPAYHKITEDGFAMQAARALVFEGDQAPSGYTEPALHAARLAYKASTNS